MLASSEKLLSKSLPASPDVERLVLGAMLLTNALIDQWAERVTEAYFSLDAHRRVWRGMLALRQTSAVDPITLCVHLEREGDLNPVGGMAYLANLIDGVPRFSILDSYIAILRDKAALRQIILESNAAMSAAIEGEQTPQQILDCHVTRLADIGQSLLTGQNGRQELIGKAIPYVGEWIDGVNLLTVPPGISTGLAPWNNLLLSNGWSEGTLNLLGGRTSVGKTKLALQVASDNALAGYHVGYFSFEMDRERLVRRIAMDRAGISVGDLKRQSFTAEQMRGVQEIVAALKKSPLAVFSQRTLSVAELRQRVLQHEAVQGKFDLVIVDHFGLLLPPFRGAKIYDKTVENSHSLFQFSHDYGTRLLNLVQINRAGELDDRLELRHLEGGGALEQDADTVLLLQKRTDYDQHGWTVVCTLDKNRDAPVGWFTLRQDTASGRFEPLSGERSSGYGIWQPEKKTNKVPWES